MLHSIKYNKLSIKGNILSSPLAGYTDFPTRMLFQKFGADLTFTEMVSANGIVYNHQKTLNLLYTTKAEKEKAVQIFGDDKYIIKDAIDYISANTPYKTVNLNAGCPIKKIIRANKGGALIRDIDKLKGILNYLSDKVNINFTIKIRSGWDQNSLNYEYIGKLAQDNNCCMIIFHPRTVKQVFTGKADWDLIYDLKKKLRIPVIGNGDIFTPEDAYDKLKKDIDGIMIARGSIGNPWIFENIKRKIKGKKYKVPTTKERVSVMCTHLKMMMNYYGERKGIILFRSQMLQYMKNFRNSAKIRKKLQICELFNEIKHILKEGINML